MTDLIGELLATVVVIALVYGMNYVRNRWKIDVATHVKDLIGTAVVDAVHIVEEEKHQDKARDKEKGMPKFADVMMQESRAIEVARELAIEGAKLGGKKLLVEVTKAVSGVDGLGVIKKGILAVLGSTR